MDAVSTGATRDDRQIGVAERAHDQGGAMLLRGGGENLDVVHQRALVGLWQAEQHGGDLAGRAGLRKPGRKRRRVFDDGSNEVEAGCWFAMSQGR